MFSLQVRFPSLHWLCVLTTIFRIRRVKCDETKPFCNKCTSTGRTCEGYTTPLPRKSRTRLSKYDVLQMSLDRSTNASFDTSDITIIPNSNVYDVVYAWCVPRSVNHTRDRVDWDESRSLAYYSTRVSKDICNHFDEDFWNNLVLQISEEEPAVRHALLALSTLYEAGDMSRLANHHFSRDRYKQLMRSAIHQHNKAISILRSRIDAGGPLEVVMMSCLIFTWLEFLRGNVNDALTHLHSGLRILCEQPQLKYSQAVKHMASVLGRALVQAALHRSSALVFDYYAATGYSPNLTSLKFATLREARCDIDGKISSALYFLRRIGSAGLARLDHECSAFPYESCLKCMHQAHIRDFSQWKASFESLRNRLDFDSMTANQLQSIHQLELCHLLMSNTFDILFAATPMIFDKFNHVYARMLYLSRQILRNQISRRTTSQFMLPIDNSVQGGLLNVIFRCRHLPIRSEAVQLLQQCPENDGIWQRTSLVALCKWKIDTEENRRPPGALETDPLPENARVYAEKAREVMRDGQSLVMIRFKRGASSSTSDVGLEETEAPHVSMRLAELLGMQGSLTLRPSKPEAEYPATKTCVL